MPALFDAGATDAPLFDAARYGDASPQLGWVDFAISGCRSGDGSEASPCLGPSPLVLQFTVLAPAQVESQVWDFGDGSEPDPSRGPVHRFADPGSYDIGLNVDGPGGSAGRIRLAAVVVIPAPLGAQCSIASQCASADCVCGESANCSEPFDDGICMLTCDSHAECGGNPCVDLRRPMPLQPWQQATCLPACTLADPSCGPDASCQALLGIDGVLTHACFPSGLLTPIGGSCRDAEGLLNDAPCASGLCLDLGLRGMCSANCEESACPEGTACATPTSGSPAPLCVASCEFFACDGDAELSCRAPGTDFTVDEAEAPEGYCTPSFT